MSGVVVMRADDPSLDLAAHEAKDVFAAKRYNGGVWHNGVKAFVIGHGADLGSGFLLIRAKGQADASGAIRYALRIDPKISRVAVADIGKPGNVMRLVLNAGEWVSLS